VCTFNSGAMTMYVNGVSVATASLGASSIPAGAYNQVIGGNPGDGPTDYFFGYISNLWVATGVMEQAGVTAAYGSTSPTGGAGGGGSGSAGGAGFEGNNASAGLGGSGGAAVVLPTQYASIRTAGNAGANGANAGASGSNTTSLGAGGAGGGDMAASPATVTLTVPFASAATYCGTDSSSPGALYNASQQSGNSLIVTGGISTDQASGSKNTLVLLPKGIASSLGNGKWTVQQITLTLTNSLLSNVDTVLEFAYTADTSLPQTYTGSDIVEYVGAVPLDSGENTVTIDLTQSNLGALIQNGSCTALCFGPANNPTFDAYNATTGAQFYCQVYGPGAVDNFGNSLQPYLTITLQETLTTQHGGRGGSGAIRITSLAEATTPVTMVQPFAGTDSGGNQYASGLTGATTAYNPSSLTPGSYIPETWHTIGTEGSSFGTGWSLIGNAGQPIQFMLDTHGNVHLNGAVNCASGTAENAQNLFTLPAAWCPNRTVYIFYQVFPYSTANVATSYYATLNTSGTLSIGFPATTTITAVIFNGYFPLVSNT
jgi:hypothetical protein